MSKTRFVMVVTVVVLSLLLVGIAFASDVYPNGDTTMAESNPPHNIAPLAAWPGPDGYGYGGQTVDFNWLDITATGTLVTGWTSLDDGYAGPFPIGFSFDFYGTDWTEFFTNSNGFISFGAGSTSLSNQCPLPSSTTPNNIIPILWDDLNLNISGDVYYQYFDICPFGSGQCTVIEYFNIAHYSGAQGSAGTWEVVLYDSSEIMIQFLDAGVETGLSSTTGIENDNAAADYGLTYACNTADSISNELAIDMTVNVAPRLSDSTKFAPSYLDMGNPVNYTIEIKNTGDAPALEATLEDPIPGGTIYNGDVACDSGTCEYNEVENQVEWTGIVDVDSSVLVTFSVLPDTAGCGDVVVNEAVINDPEILNPVNVSFTTYIVNYIYYFEEFNEWDGNYTNVGVNPWTWGPPPLNLAPAHSGENAWSTESPYVVNADYQLISPLIDLTAANPDYNLYIQWWQKLDVEVGYDYAYVDVSTDGETWDTVWVGNYHGSWESVTADITPYIGQIIQLRFQLTSDGSVQYNGWAIDDVSIHSGCEELLYPNIVVDPLSLEATLSPDQQETQLLNVCNAGDAPLTWEISEVLPGINKDKLLAPTDMGYAQDIGYISDNFVSFTLNDFTGQTVIGTTSNVYYGMDFDPSATILYALNDTTDELGTVDLTTGAFTGLVPCPPPVDIWTGLSIDPNTGIFYASDATDLYTIDPTTGASTLVGSFGTGLMIDISMGPAGDMYGHDIGTDAIYQIDPNTGSATLVGSTGYNANYAQGMDFDNQDGTLYIWLYQGSGVNVYGTVNLTTGVVTPLAVSAPLGEFEGATQTVAGPPPDLPWLSEDPMSGELLPGECSDINVTFDSTGLTPDTYTGGLDVSSNDPDEPHVNVPVTLNVIGAPSIVVTPLALETTLVMDQFETLPLTITNEGEVDLTWDVYDGANIYGWFEDFESYDSGSQMHGQGGWKGWGNDPGAGALVSDAESHSPSNSVAILGSSDLVHEYSGYTSGSWTYTAWQFVPDAFSGQSYFILLNQYDDPGITNNWSVQVYFDGATNQVVNTGISGGLLDLIKGAWVELRVEIDLTNDIATFFYDGQELYTGTWTNEVSVGGILNIGAVDLFANGATTVYYDDISLGHFEDTPWLSEDPMSGTTPAGESSPVAVTFDATGLDAGIYETMLFVESNDPATPLVMVPVTMNVIAPEADLDVVKSGTPDEVKVGDLITYTIDVTNLGPQTATNVMLVDTLPGLVVYQSDDSMCSLDAGEVTCDLGSIDMNNTVTVQIVVMATAEGLATNSVEVSSDIFDPDLSNNTDSADTLIHPAILYVYLPFVAKP